MIREATLEDIPELLRMGAAFSELAQLSTHVGYDPASMEKTFRVMIESEAFVIFVGGGAIGGMIAPHPFNHAALLADELFWWSEGNGLGLLRAFENWAESQGAIVRMTALEAASPERVGKIYARRGYVPLERAYVKVR